MLRNPSISLAPILMWISSLVAPLQTTAGPNAYATLPLHAVETEFGVCAIADPCDPGPPTVEVPVGSTIAVYLLVRHYGDVVGLQTAFDWPESWVFLFGLWDCLPGQVTSATPFAPGPEYGTLTTAFDPLTGGQATVIGRMHMIASRYGCIVQVDSSLPEGTHFLSSLGEIDPPELSSRSGTVCAGNAGEDGCNARPMVRAACCRNDGSCDGLFWRCDDGYVLWQHSCDYCVWQGACCYPDDSCESTDNNACALSRGTFYAGLTCEDVDCLDPVELSTWGQVKVRYRE